MSCAVGNKVGYWGAGREEGLGVKGEGRGAREVENVVCCGNTLDYVLTVFLSNYILNS